MELEKNYKIVVKSIFLSKFRKNNSVMFKNFKIFLFFKKSSMCLIAYIILILLFDDKIRLIFNKILATEQKKPKGFSVVVKDFWYLQKIVLLFLGVSRDLTLNICKIRSQNFISFPLKYDYTDLFELLTISHIYSEGIDGMFLYFKLDLLFRQFYYYECFFRIIRIPIIFKKF